MAGITSGVNFMKPRLVIILLIIVLAPVALLGWLGTRLARHEVAAIERRFDELLLSRLGDVDADIVSFFSERERQFLELTQQTSNPDPDDFREIVRENPIISQMFFLDADGRLIHPAPNGELTESEKEFLRRSHDIWLNKELLRLSGVETNETHLATPHKLDQQNSASSSNQSNKSDKFNKLLPGHGWFTWYWGRGLNVIFWRRDSNGRVIGVELDRTRLMADVIGRLPDTAPLISKSYKGRMSKSSMQQKTTALRMALIDANGDVVYQWGTYEPPKNTVPRVSRALSAPMSSWRLDYFMPEDLSGASLQTGFLINLAVGLTVVVVVLISLGFYFYQESSRELREASQRVTFVNQVSHELKTPLTNIRMYAELLEGVLDEEDEREQKGRRHTEIIIDESRRLSRLIANILTFSRRRRGKLTLYKKDGVIDEVIERVLQQFRPSLESKGINVSFSGDAAMTVCFDADAFEQILGNLFSNVEKYAATGGTMEVSSCLETSRKKGNRAVRAIIAVSDRGPGVPKKQREKIFAPFTRLNNSLTEGVSGAGIGLALSRDLARLHGGDLQLKPTKEQGATFELLLRIEQQKT